MINKAIHLALGINLDGSKELLGMWVTNNEGSKFWLSVLTELKNRGLQDIFIACVDGLTGFPEAISISVSCDKSTAVHSTHDKKFSTFCAMEG